MALVIFLLFISLPLQVLAATRPRPLVWSPNAYGPDGPWQAVMIKVGTPSQTISLYPGGAFESLVFAPSICGDNTTTCQASLAGTYNGSRSSTTLPVPFGGSITNTSFQEAGGMQNLTGSGSYVLDTMKIIPPDGFTEAVLPNFDMFVVTTGFETLADGTQYPAQVGNLALGAEVTNQTWANGTTQTNGTIITNFLFELSDAGNRIPSNSYGLHIGSSKFQIPGSLYLGGYDQNRIVGPVSTQAYGQSSLPIDLLDIGIGTDIGGSPFNYTSKHGLLAEGNSTITGDIPVEVDPKEPYLYLPVSTCQAIAKELPVTYQPKYGFYFWNTNDPLYQTLMTSPTYLSFTFRLNNTIGLNMTIKVPFALLSLNLTAPLESTPTPYFPCSLPRLPAFRLGRSFLQAAFISINWMTDYEGSWFLAQAPGPNIPLAPNVFSIGSTDRYLLPSTNDWATSWSKTLKALPGGNQTLPSGNQGSTGGNQTDSGSTITTTEPPKKSSLSGGVIAGIVIGAIAALLIVATAVYHWRRRSKKKAAAIEAEKASNAVVPIDERDGKWNRVEMHSGMEHSRYEMPGFGHYGVKPGESPLPNELPG